MSFATSQRPYGGPPRSSVRPRAPSLPSVLVIDDDDMVRRVLTRMLRRKYVVTEMRGAEEALAAITSGERFDGILCDLNLVGMSGRELLLRLRAESPSQASRVIILSGSGGEYLDDPVLGTARCLEKPATALEIEQALAELVAVPARAA